MTIGQALLGLIALWLAGCLGCALGWCLRARLEPPERLPWRTRAPHQRLTVVRGGRLRSRGRVWGVRVEDQR